MFHKFGPEHPAHVSPSRPPAVSQADSLDPAQFVRDVEPLLERQDLPGLIRLLGRRYPCADICALLAGPDADARKVAALALALVGNAEAVPVLARHLKDPDPMVNQMAEHALWSIWFRGGTREANDRLLAGVECVNNQQLEDAVDHFCAAISLFPGFAEAYHQRAIVHYLRERLDESLRDCRLAVELMPCHFGAWSAMGHCHALRGDLEAALGCYRQAADINTHLGCIRELIAELESNPGAARDIEEWTEAWIPRRRAPGCRKPG
jgi:tetratricopeptide (TPR) repeat protein